MSTQQGLRQQSVRDVTGTEYDYSGDWHALFDLRGIAAGTFNERLLQWINTRLSSSYTEINGAMAALAAFYTVDTFQQIGTFDAAIVSPLTGTPMGLLLSLTYTA